MLYRLFGDINIVIIIELSNSLAFFITLFEYLRNLNKEYIHIINREKPIIDYSLLDKQINSRDSVIYLRIDNWLKFFLE